jgi:Ca2+-binding RTX toxin-like protein
VTSSNGTSITLFGGSNNDTLSATGGTSITLFGGAGNNDSLSSSGGTSITLYGGSGSASLVSSGGSTITLFGGGSNNDTLSSTNGLSITLFGGAGNNDSLSASGGTSVTLFGGSGTGDTLTSTGGTTISLFGGSGSDSLSATGGTSVTLFSGAGSDSLSTSGGTSVSLFGGSGDDTLSSSSGSSVGQFGEDGNNLYNVFATAGNPINVVLNDLNTFGADLGLIDGQTNGINTIAFPGVANAITLNLSITSTGSSQTLTPQTVTSYITLSLVGLFQGVIGTPFADNISGNSANDSIVGGGGNDTLTAGSGNTTLVAGAGNVSLVGGTGNDTFQFAGNSFGNDVVNQPTPLPAVLPSHALDFSKTSGPININIASAAQQTAFASPPARTALNLTLNSPQTIAAVIGSPAGNDTITGNARNDSVYPGAGNDSLVGGGGNDAYFFGAKVGNDTVNAGASKDTFNYQAASEPLTLDLNKTSQTIMQDPATLTLINPNSVIGVIGTPYPDKITGNNNNLTLIGGGGEDSITSGNGNDLIESNIIQVVFLDFDSQTQTQRGDHVYAAAERSAILGTLQSAYAAFNYTFTLDPVQAQQLAQPTGSQYMTLFFNKPPAGGKSDNLDWRHLILGGTASIDVNPFIGTGGNEVSPTLPGGNSQAVDTYVTLSAEIAAHELGHLSAGLRHGDAFGPIGTGMYAGINPANLYPQPTLPLPATNAPETTEHIMSSPDSTGVTLTQSASGTFFGEREDIRLAFVDTGMTINSSSVAHNSQATAQALGVLPGLAVPNTITNPNDRDYGKTLAVRAIDVVGALAPNPSDPQHRATDDYYSFTGNAGDIVNIQAISSALTRSTKPIDTVVYLFNSNGNLLTYSDDEFETKDSWIADYKLPGTLGTSSTYYVEVDSYTPDGIVDFNVGNYDLFMYSFTVPTASTTSLGSGDTIMAGSGIDTIISSSGNDVVQFPSGMHAPALTLGTITGPSVTLPNQSITLSDTLTFFPTNKRHTAVFNWGDGTSAGLVAESNGLGTVTGNHTYTVPGVYLVSLTVTQSDNSSITATTNFVVTVGDSVYVLNSTASGALTISGTSSIKVLGPVDVDSKSSSAILATGSASITASQINVVGGVSLSSTATLSPAPHTAAAAVADPLAGLPGPAASPSLGAVNLTNSNKLTVNPGTYSQISVSGMAVLTMNPGIYVIEGGGFTVSNGGSVSGNGVLIFNAGSNYPNSGTSGATFGGITLSGAGTFNLTAPTSGTYAGVVIYQARNNTRALSIGNSAMAGMRGVVYAPYALLTLSGSSQTKASLVVGTLNLSGSVALTQMAQGSDGGDIATIADTLLAGNLNVYIDPNSSFSADQLARIQDVINTWDALLAPYNVVIAEVNDPTQANLVLDAATTSPCGGMAQGVLGCFDPANSVITIIQGWNWYTGADPTQIGTAQYDFSTTVTHEFGHALGLGGVTDPNSPMYETLPTGVAHRAVGKADLNIPDAPVGVDPLTATGFQTTHTPAKNAAPAEQIPVRQTGLPSSASLPAELLVQLAQSAMQQQPVTAVPTIGETSFFTPANLQVVASSSVPRTAVAELFIGFPYDSGDGESEDRAAWDDFWLDFGDDSSTVAPVPNLDGTARGTSSSRKPTPTPEVDTDQDNDSDVQQDRYGLESMNPGFIGEHCWLELALAAEGTPNQAASDQYFADFGGDSAGDGMSPDEPYDD